MGAAETLAEPEGVPRPDPVRLRGRPLPPLA